MVSMATTNGNHGNYEQQHSNILYNWLIYYADCKQTLYPWQLPMVTMATMQTFLCKLYCKQHIASNAYKHCNHGRLLIVVMYIVGNHGNFLIWSPPLIFPYNDIHQRFFIEGEITYLSTITIWRHFVTLQFLITDAMIIMKIFLQAPRLLFGMKSKKKTYLHKPDGLYMRPQN